MLRIDQSRKFGSQPRDILGTPSKDYSIENHGIHKKYKLKPDGTGTVRYGTLLIKYFT
jgi:hypothetical protein